MPPRITESDSENNNEVDELDRPTQMASGDPDENAEGESEQQDQEGSEYDDELDDDAGAALDDKDDEYVDSSRAATPPSPSRSGRVTAQSTGGSGSRGQPLRLKLKLGSSATGSSVDNLRDESRRPRKRPKHLQEGYDFSSDSDESALSASRLAKTARQRGDVELQSLPMEQTGKKKQMTEAERALKKAEDSRKRKSQSHKKLEDEKTETINRLLKKQAGKASTKTSKSTPDMTTPAEPSDEAGLENRTPKDTTPKPAIPSLFRYVSTVKNGDYAAGLSAPIGLEQSTLVSTQGNATKHTNYPPPRPAPQSRSFKT